jgi:hypothetical protein
MSVIPFPARNKSAGSLWTRGMRRVRWSTEVMRAIQSAVAPLAAEAPTGERIEIEMRVATEGSRVWFTMLLDRHGVSLIDSWTD